MKKIIVLLCVIAATTSACNTTGRRGGNAQATGTEVADPAHNSRNSLDWAGVYKGTLPCADCEGIEVEIRLNDDLSYERVMTYLGKGDNRFSDNGRLEWDENGTRIKLINSTSPDAADNWFQVGENRLFVLDTEGNPIESTFPPETYIFEKIDMDYIVTEKYWKLTELNGKGIIFSEGQIREAYFILKNEDNRVIGNTGCNNMSGSYVLLKEEEDSIRFSPLVTTRMACIGVDYEADYLDVFQTCDNYTVENDTLTLRKGETPLARFVAVYLQ